MTTDTDTNDQTPAGPSPLDSLDNAASALDGAAAEAAQPAPPPTVATNTAAELLGALQLARLPAAQAFAWWPQFGEVWGDQTLTGIAESGGAIMDRHGWSMGEVMSTWGPYIGLAGTLGPAILVTVQAVKVQKAALAQQQRQPAAPPQAPDQ